MSKEENNKIEIETTTEQNTIHSLFTEIEKEFTHELDLDQKIRNSSYSVTTFSKRMIFTLHRLSNPSDNQKAVMKRAGTIESECLENLQNLMKLVLESPDYYWKYQYRITQGMQEFLEALSFKHWLETKEVITLEQINKKLAFDFLKEETFLITAMDYVGGIADLTGELMRFATDSYAKGNHQILDKILETMKKVYKDTQEALGINSLKMWNKLSVMGNSIEKVENLCYLRKLRLSNSDQKIAELLLD
ncbi:translin and translin associated protein x [Anaeramoeba flamelloides]|uniref:Translin and translin associated protein x n=1 Tax=Anaeramoeba flamelloides TaxID=1746091 RepID=A0ABQ8XQV2_9EUKA|nr:translin and translin associated protein x [Anaeramoeba flamelloides]